MGKIEEIQKIAKQWLIAMLGEEVAERFNDKWCAIEAGEVLHKVNPLCKEETLIWPKEEESCGYNAGCSIFHTGTGISILSCDFNLYYELAHKVKTGAWVLGYNGGVWYDTEDRRILKMSVLCKSYAEGY